MGAGVTLAVTLTPHKLASLIRDAEFAALCGGCGAGMCGFYLPACVWLRFLWRPHLLWTED